MSLDERRRIDPAACVFAITRADEGRGELAHFKVQMCEVTAIRGADRCDLLAAPHIFAGTHQHLFNVTVIRLHEFSFTVVDVGVQHNDYVAPAWTAIARE